MTFKAPFRYLRARSEAVVFRFLSMMFQILVGKKNENVRRSEEEVVRRHETSTVLRNTEGSLTLDLRQNIVLFTERL